MLENPKQKWTNPTHTLHHHYITEHGPELTMTIAETYFSTAFVNTCTAHALMSCDMALLSHDRYIEGGGVWVCGWYY
jgi:hypothetical protein